MRSRSIMFLLLFPLVFPFQDFRRKLCNPLLPLLYIHVEAPQVQMDTTRLWHIRRRCQAPDVTAACTATQKTKATVVGIREWGPADSDEDAMDSSTPAAACR